MKLKQLIENYLIVCKYQNNLNDKTIKAYRLDLNQFEQFQLGKDEFYEKEFILKYINFLNKQNYKIKTVKRKIASIKAFISYLNYEDIIESNPFYKIRLKIKEPSILPKVINLNNIQKLFQQLYDEKSKLNNKSYKYKEITRNILALEILFSTGIRISELCNLKQKDLNILNNSIKIYGKGSKERIIPIFDKNIWKMIKEYNQLFLKQSNSNEYFLLNKLGNKLSDQSIRNMLNKYVKKANINTRITPHMFRHTFATMLLEEDVDIRNIQQILGHSNIMTTQIYTHITSNKKNEIMKNKNPRSKICIK